MLAVTLLARIGNAFGFRASKSTDSSTLSGVIALTCTERGVSSGGFGFEQASANSGHKTNDNHARRFILASVCAHIQERSNFDGAASRACTWRLPHH